jgi:DNA-binding NtrC family response regulator
VTSVAEPQRLTQAWADRELGWLCRGGAATEPIPAVVRATRNRLRAIPNVARCACGEIVIASELRPNELRWCSECRAFVDEVVRSPRAPVLAPSQLPAEGMNLVAYLDMVERSLIQQALDRTDGNKAQAAKLLGLNRTTLVEKMKRQGAEK